MLHLIICFWSLLSILGDELNGQNKERTGPSLADSDVLKYGLACEADVACYRATDLIGTPWRVSNRLIQDAAVILHSVVSCLKHFNFSFLIVEYWGNNHLFNGISELYTETAAIGPFGSNYRLYYDSSHLNLVEKCEGHDLSFSKRIATAFMLSFTGYMFSDVHLSSSLHSSPFWSSSPPRNVKLYVSTSGEDQLNCGEYISPCRTVYYAYFGALDQIYPEEILFEEGKYLEVNMITVTRSLTVTGVSATKCELSKKSNLSPPLFSITGLNKELTMATLTITLTGNTAENNVFVEDTGVNSKLTFDECYITTESSEALYGQNIRIVSDTAVLKLTDCKIYNISSNYSFIYCVNAKTLWISNSSFANVRNTYPTVLNESSGCFFVGNADNITLELSAFIACSSSGYCANLKSEGSVDSCKFLNNSGYTGVLHIVSKVTSCTLSVVVTSFIGCSATHGSGGALYLEFLQSTLTDCSFASCSCTEKGGAICLSFCSFYITRCTFIKCKNTGTPPIRGHGGSLCLLESDGNLTDSLFLESTALNGSDIYVGYKSDLEITNTFTDKSEVAFSVSLDGAITGTVFYSSDLDNVVCVDTFTTDDPNYEERCKIPCAADQVSGTCVKSSDCPSNYTAVNGQCVPVCTFWSGTAAEGGCGLSCAYDVSLGFPLCIECTSLIPNTSSSTYPCGTSGCYLQVNSDGDDLLACAPGCPPHSTPENGRCEYLQCSNRTVELDGCGPGCYTDNAPTDSQCVTSCSNSDWYAPLNGVCTLMDCSVENMSSGLCVQQPVERPDKGKNKGMLTGIIIGIVVAVAIAVVIMFFLLRNRKKSKTLYDVFKPRKIGEFTVMGSLGRGSSGEVFEVTGEGGNQLALKAIGMKTAGAEKAFLDQHLSCPRSKFLVKYYSSFIYEDVEYIAMELCPKGDLRGVIQKLRDLNAILNHARAQKILVQLLLGLDVMHCHGAIHQDLKPDNIFIDKNDNIKIGDFGCFVKVHSGNQDLTGKVGSPAYMSPEMWNGKAYSMPTDMWSVGVLMYEMITLSRPFDPPGDDVKVDELNRRIVNGIYEPISLEHYPPELSKVVELIDSLLKVNPAERPTARGLLQKDYIIQYAKESNLFEYYPEELK